MSILGFLTGSNPQRVVIKRDASEGPQLPGLTLDAATNLNPSRDSNPTTNPVESGALISDHVTLGNLKFGLEGIISETPLPFSPLESALGALAGVAGGAIGTLVGGGIASQAATAAVSSIVTKEVNFALSPDISSGASLEAQVANRIPGDADFPRKAYEYLLGLQQDRSLLTVITRMKTYTSLVLVSLSAPQTIENGRSIKFTALFEQIQIVQSVSVQLPESVIAANATGAASKANLGKQSAGAATGAQAENVSILSGLTGVGG